MLQCCRLSPILALMCGIAGILSFTESDNFVIDAGVLDAMSNAIAHRGPDDSGVFVEAPVALAHRRLSILDLSPRGHQPLFNESGTRCVVFNGEIYDHAHLRRELESRGHVFSSDTDTETLIHLHEDLGGALTDRISGMYAFAIWDRERRSLLLARDRFGKKPLYYAPIPGGLAFASEMKGLLRHPAVSRDLDRESLHEFLLLGYVPGEATIFAGIRKVPPGGTVEVDANGIVVREGVTPVYAPASDRLEWNSFLASVGGAFSNAVKRRLVADVEVGVFLSGGVDSSLVAHSASSLHPGIRTFAMGFETSAFDESEAARESARVLGTRHHEERMSANDLLALMPRVFDTFDEPFADASMIPTWALARMAAEKVKVVLSGDGGDELFGGYPTLRAQRWADTIDLFPGSRAIAVSAARAVPDGHGYYAAGYLLRRFASGLNLPAWKRQFTWTAYVPPDELGALLGIENAWPSRLKAAAAKIDARAEIASHNLDLRFYLPGDILVKTDRASMAHGLEVRCPFLDQDLAALALVAPPIYLREKRALRSLLARTPLHRRARAPKRGFAVPIAEWLRRPLKEWADARLETVHEIGLDPAIVRGWWSEHLSERRDRWRELWAVLALQEWRARWMSGGVFPG